MNIKICVPDGAIDAVKEECPDIDTKVIKKMLRCAIEEYIEGEFLVYDCVYLLSDQNKP